MPKEKEQDWTKIHEVFGFEPLTIKGWKNCEFSYEETDLWIKAGLDPKNYFLAFNLKENLINPFRYKMFDKKNAQEWLEHFYTPEQRKKAEKLDIAFQNLEGDLNLKDFPNLETFHCGVNKLTSLDLSGCPKLKSIDCPLNQLTNLDFSKNPQLKELRCWKNPPLTILDISKNLELSLLECYSCPNLVNLDLSNNFQLEKVLCFDNKLTELKLNKSSPLQEFVCRDNNFRKTDLTIFTSFINLRVLDISNSDFIIPRENCNRFIGSLEPFKLLKKLECLNIEGTEIDSGLEYLSSFFNHLYLSPKLQQELREYGKMNSKNPSYDNNYSELFNFWKTNILMKKWEEEGFSKEEIENWKNLGWDLHEYEFASYLKKNRVDLPLKIKEYKKHFLEVVNNRVLFERWKKANEQCLLNNFNEHIEITKKAINAPNLIHF